MEDKRISEYDNLAAAEIQDTDLLEIGRPSIKNFKLTWANLRLAVITFLSDILLGKEDVSNKKTDLTDNSDTFYVSQKAVKTAIDSVNTAIDSVNTAIDSKQDKKRIYSTSSASSLTPEIDTYDIFEFTALAANLTINNYSSSTPVNGEMMMFIIKDDGTARTISWGNKFANGCATLPTTTTASKRSWILVQWCGGDSKWYCISVGTSS